MSRRGDSALILTLLISIISIMVLAFAVISMRITWEDRQLLSALQGAITAAEQQIDPSYLTQQPVPILHLDEAGATQAAQDAFTIATGALGLRGASMTVHFYAVNAQGRCVFPTQTPPDAYRLGSAGGQFIIDNCIVLAAQADYEPLTGMLRAAGMQNPALAASLAGYPVPLGN